ncbi:tetratricopeptide repeat protein [Sphingorhabdus wooponensis]|uniref:Tetratricopeptide repeat protein n=1 Tax=Sphingorhabdus wooponensis TaxID=940136 RepID=A0A3R8Q3G2_9SPHN|nr:tetratricopeptide repeat protein [Sphingorhabdus wooponensis]RRQ51482.1 tetratricopeptide repeat protein [Sphingorhabdus wooponensis]
MTNSATIAREAAALASQGDNDGADALYVKGLALFPEDARFANSVGNFYAHSGRSEEALELFTRALQLDRNLEEAAFNKAILLLRLGRSQEAFWLLTDSWTGHTNAKYWALRGDAERLSDDFSAARSSYDRSLTIEPINSRALTGRARLALECGDEKAVACYEEALAQSPGDPKLFLDYTQALVAAGRQSEALECASALVDQLPTWVEGHSLYAEMLWSSGNDAQFGSKFEKALLAHPTPELYLGWAHILSGIDRFAEAAEVLRQAHKKWPENRTILLDLCIALGEAGAGSEAEQLFSRFDQPGLAEWHIARCRNLIRIGLVDQAERRLFDLTKTKVADISAWSLLDICWRLKGDTRHEWLHGQTGLVREIALPLCSGELSNIQQCLLKIHETSAPPVGQSVKSGSQTKGALFARRDPELTHLKTALLDILNDYRAGLPKPDPLHPLLSKREPTWGITSSWSIRLFGRGNHAPHIHPKGLISSACYFEVPAEVSQQGGPGWLDLGAPPINLETGLPALFSFEPTVGSCILFPSTMFHGTRPISEGSRMTVAFDVTVVR